MECLLGSPQIHMPTLVESCRPRGSSKGLHVGNQRDVVEHEREGEHVAEYTLGAECVIRQVRGGAKACSCTSYCTGSSSASIGRLSDTCSLTAQDLRQGCRIELILHKKQGDKRTKLLLECGA
jgi:hypothetical protein